MSAYKTNCEKQEFQIDGCVISKAQIGDVGLTFTPTAYNVDKEPITWSLDAFDGDIQNAIIDTLTGEITYDATDSLSNNGNSSFTITATDDCGKKFTKKFCFKINDPVIIIPLACNGDLQTNNEDIVDKLILFAKAEEGAMYQDLAKTIPATATGDPVSVLEDATGGGDLSVRVGNTPPTIELSSFNGNNALKFERALSSSLQYDVPAAPSAGSAFKFFAVVQIESLDESSSIISSTSIGNNNTTANGTWQICDDNGFFAFRQNGANLSNATVGTIARGDDLRTDITRAQITDGQTHLLYLNYTGSQIEFYVDGVIKAACDVSQPLLAQHLKIFENRGGNTFVDGLLAEAIYADATMTEQEALTTQAYLICKYGLDASLLAYASPFPIDLETCYDTISQFQYQTLSDGTSVVYDVVNNQYYESDDVPAPDLGLLKEPTCATSFDPASIESRLDAIELQLPETDDQQISAIQTGNILDVTLEDGGQFSIDFTPYLPDGTGTDDQQIVQFGVVGTNIVLELENGGTSNIPLSALPDNDQQTISRAGDTISILNGNSLDLSDLRDNTDEQTISITEVDEFNTDFTISNGNTETLTHLSRNVGNWLKTSLTDYNHDLASTVEATLPIMGQVDANEIAATVDTVAHTITIGEAGRYDILCNISFSESTASNTNTQRDNIKFYIRVNGVQIGRNYQENYLRDVSGHNEVGQTISYKSDLNIDDVLDIRRVQISGSGGVVTPEVGITHDLILTRIK